MSAALADLILVVHLAYAGFVVLGFAALSVGGPLGWRWVRRRGWRLAHALAVGFVGVEAAIGMACPLTLWEYALRQPTGSQPGAPDSFIGRIASRLLYYDLPPWVFTAAYLALTALVIALWVLVPPRRKAA